MKWLAAAVERHEPSRLPLVALRPEELADEAPARSCPALPSIVRSEMRRSKAEGEGARAGVPDHTVSTALSDDRIEFHFVQGSPGHSRPNRSVCSIKVLSEAVYTDRSSLCFYSLCQFFKGACSNTGKGVCSSLVALKGEQVPTRHRQLSAHSTDSFTLGHRPNGSLPRVS